MTTREFAGGLVGCGVCMLALAAYGWSIIAGVPYQVDWWHLPIFLLLYGLLSILTGIAFFVRTSYRRWIAWIGTGLMVMLFIAVLIIATATWYWFAAFPVWGLWLGIAHRKDLIRT
jgi:hypothetical protein